MLKPAAPYAEGIFVRPKVRLDSVVKLEETREEKRLSEMSDASRALKAAEDRLAQRKADARMDLRRRASASDWLLTELSHTRALADVRAAEHAVKEATVASTASRDRYTQQYMRAEAMRRVADARADEIT